MSTDHQKYSIINQSAVVRDYALSNGFEIVCSYCDHGKSGLTLDGRPALQQLICDVQSGLADFETVLVFDVSRWGRFQDIDESAYYEFLCNRAGIAVHYCAEPFLNDESALSTIIKALKRAMAGEFSRDLSQKVFAGQLRLAKLGIHLGGRPCFGYRRELRSEAGMSKGVLKSGEQKNLKSEHVGLVPGPPEEVEIVQWIFKVFAEGAMREREIASSLNQRGSVTTTGGPWCSALVQRILINEKYAGVSVWNKNSSKLKCLRRENPVDQHVRVKGAFVPIVARELFDETQAVIARRAWERSREGLLQRLREVHEQHGKVTFSVLKGNLGSAMAWRYREQFGSIMLALEAAGIPLPKRVLNMRANRELVSIRDSVVTAIIEAVQCRGGTVTISGRFLCINNEFTAAVVLMPQFEMPNGEAQWRKYVGADAGADVLVAVRMNSDQISIDDYCVIPGIELPENVLRLSRCRDRFLDSYRFDDLSVLFAMVERSDAEAPI